MCRDTLLAACWVRGLALGFEWRLKNLLPVDARDDKMYFTVSVICDGR